MTEDSQTPASRPLARSASDRIVGGVCGGLAEHFGIDPIIPRVLFGVGVFAALALVLPAYLVLWLVLPGRPDERRSYAPLLWIGAVVLVLASMGWIVGVNLLGGWGFVALLAVFVAGLGVVLRRRPAPGTAAAAAVAPPPPVVTDGGASTDTGGTDPQVPAWWQAQPPPAAPRRPSSPLPRVATGAALVAGGALLATRQPLRVVLASMLAIVGAGLLVGSVRGRARSLLPLAALLGAAVAVTHLGTVPEATPARGTYLRPARFDLTPVHRIDSGAVTLDLRELSADERAIRLQMEVDVGIGHVVVLLPADAPVDVAATVGAGRLTLDGRVLRGVNRSGSATTGAPKTGLPFRVTVRVGIGQLEVRRGTA